MQNRQALGWRPWGAGQRRGPARPSAALPTALARDGDLSLWAHPGPTAAWAGSGVCRTQRSLACDGHREADHSRPGSQGPLLPSLIARPLLLTPSLTPGLGLFLRVLSPVPALGSESTVLDKGGLPPGWGVDVPCLTSRVTGLRRGDRPRGWRKGTPWGEGQVWELGRSTLASEGGKVRPAPAPSPRAARRLGGRRSTAGCLGGRAERRPSRKCRVVLGCGEHRVGVLGRGCPRVCCCICPASDLRLPPPCAAGVQPGNPGFQDSSSAARPFKPALSVGHRPPRDPGCHPPLEGTERSRRKEAVLSGSSGLYP